MNKNILLWMVTFILLVGFVNAIDVPDGGVLYYNFSSMTDLWGSNDATNVGTTSSTDYPIFNISGDSSPNSSDFDGINDYITYSTSSLSNFTVSMWIYNTEDSTSNYVRFLITADTASSNSITYHPNLNKIIIYDSSGDGLRTLSEISRNEWHNIIYTQSGSTYKLYIDGEEVGYEELGDFSGLDFSSGSFYTGGGDTNRYFTGQIDELKIFNRDLGETEIENIYNYGNINGPEESENERFEEVLVETQTDTVTINKNNVYFPIISGNFVLPNNETNYNDITVQMESGNNIDVNCRILLDGIEIVNKSRTNTASTVGSLNIMSESRNIELGDHDFSLECKKDGTGSVFIKQSVAVLHFQNETGIQSFSGSGSANNITLDNGILQSFNITANYTGFFVTDYTLEVQNVNGSFQNIKTRANIGGENCTEYQRGIDASRTASIGGSCGIYVEEGNNYTANLYLTAENVNIVANVNSKIISLGNYSKFNDIVLTTTPQKITEININNNYTTDFVVAKSGIAVNDSSNEALFYFVIDGVATDPVEKTALSSNQVLITNTGLPETSTNFNVSLWGYTSTSTANIVSGELIAYPANEIDLNLSRFRVTAELDNGTILNNFSVKYDGVTIASTDGDIDIFTNESLFNLSVSFNNFILNQTYINHNTSNNLTAIFPLLNVTAIDINRNTSISNFSLNIYKDGTLYDEDYNTTSGEIIIPIVNGTYTVVLNSTEHLITTEEVIVSGSTSVQISVYKDGDFSFIVKDDETADIINKNITVLVQGEPTQRSLVFENGTGLIENLTDGIEYTFVFSADNYTTNTYITEFTEVLNKQITTIYLRASNETTEEIPILITNEATEQLEGVTLTVFKYVNNTISIVSIKQTDVTGSSIFNLDTSVIHYINASKDGYVDRQFQINPPLSLEGYSFSLVTETGINYSSKYSDVYWSLDPESGLLSSELTNFTLTLSTTQALDYWGFALYNGTNLLEINNITGSYGGTSVLTYDLSDFENQTLRVYVFFKKTAYEQAVDYQNYYIVRTIDERYGNLLQVREEFQSVPIKERLLIFVFVFVCTIIIFSEIGFKTGMQPKTAILIGFSLDIFVAWIIAFPYPALGAMSVIVIMGLLFNNRDGGLE